MFIVCAVQLNVICQCCNPLGGTENGISATPTVDGGRGDPIPDQGYIKKKAQVFATRCENPFNNRQTKISCRSLHFASDLGSEAKRNESAMIGGFPWETRHNYQSMMTFYTIIFLMMTHHHWINEAMITELMIV